MYLYYDDLDAGDSLDKVSFEISPLLVYCYGKLFDDDELMRLASAPAGTPIGDPTLLILCGILRGLIRTSAQPPPGGILARQDFEFASPILLASTVTASPLIADKYNKRGRNYVALRADLVDEGERQLGAVESHIIWAA